MILLDTSMLLDSLTGTRRSAAGLRRAIELGERIQLPTLVLFEWLRGPRLPEELEAQEALFPREQSIPFGPREAALAADLYGRVRNPRRRELDLAIAAYASGVDAELWTLNPQDVEGVADLRRHAP